MEVAQGMDDGTVQGSGGDKMDVDGWQDKEEFEREQSIDEGDVGARVQKVKDVEVESDLEVEPHATAIPQLSGTQRALARKDKESRKLEKKARHKAEQKAKALKKQSTA